MTATRVQSLKPIDFILIAIIVAAMIFALTSCNSAKRAQKDITKAELLDPIHLKFKDSTSTTVQYITHDSIIRIPGQTITDTFTQTKNIYHFIERKGNVTLRVTDSAGKTTAICDADSLRTACLLKDRIIKQYQDKSGIYNQPVTVYAMHFYTPIANGALVIDLLIILAAVIFLILKLWAKFKGF